VKRQVAKAEKIMAKRKKARLSKRLLGPTFSEERMDMLRDALEQARHPIEMPDHPARKVRKEAAKAAARDRAGRFIPGAKRAKRPNKFPKLLTSGGR